MQQAPIDRRFIRSASPYEEVAGYWRAVVDGDWVFVSGTVGLDFATGVIPDDVTRQCELAFDTIAAALSQAASGVDDIVRVRVFVHDRVDVPPVSQALKQWLRTNRPANTTVCCQLAVEGAKVEIEVTARRRAGTA